MPLPEIPSSQTPSEIGKVESISEEKLEKNEGFKFDYFTTSQIIS